MILSISTSEDIKRKFIDYGIECSLKQVNTIPRFWKERKTFDIEKEKFTRNGGLFEAWVVVVSNKVVGRIAAMINPDINFPEGKAGMLGMFDCDNNYEVAESLLNVSVEWLRTHQCTHIWAPMDYSIWYRYRFMTQGFDQKAYIGEPRNPDYYPEFFHQFGFEKRHDWESQVFDMETVKKLIKSSKEEYDMLISMGYEIVPFSMKKKDEFLNATYHLIMGAYQHFTGFSKIDKSHFTELFSKMPRFLDKEATIFARSQKGEYIAFSLVLKDLTEALQAMRGRSGICAKVRFLLNKSKSEYANYYQAGASLKTLMELKTIAKTRFGKDFSISRAGSHYSMKEIHQSGKYNYVIFSLMSETAPTRFISHGNFDRKRTYNMFEMKI